MRANILASFLLLASLCLSVLLMNFPTVLTQEVPKGPWVDEIIFSVEAEESKAVDMLLTKEIQVYFEDIGDPALFSKIRASPELWYGISYGLYYELTFNPVGPEFPVTGKLNPFSVPRIREAMNYLIDREHIVNEITGGLSVPKYTALTPAFPDYARYAEVVKVIEKEYSYNFDKAKEIISEEIIRLGAELRDGKWYYKGEPVTLIFVIRQDDSRRRMIGDYVASQLEKLGFTVERQYKTAGEASPIWLRGNPAEGKWHLYTAAWIVEYISRDESDNFDFFYTPRSAYGFSPLWQAYKPSPEFDEVSYKLAAKDFATMEERGELMKKALELSIKDSVRVWLVNLFSAWPASKEITLSYDLSGGFQGCRLWPYTIRYVNRIGGTIKIASSNLLVDPINPIAGSNWAFDHMFYDPLSDLAVLPDPYTGLMWPQRVKRAEVYVQEGLLVDVTLDWVSLNFVDEIRVPEDAWYDWDAEKQEIIYAPPDMTAKTKTVIYYDDDLFDTKFHDGSKLSIADFVLNYILTFDRAKPESLIYDKSYVENFLLFKETFKGFRILNENPLVIEYYSDLVYMDAEWIARDAASVFFPAYAYGPGPWHMLAIGLLAEANNELAFSSYKADELKIEWMSYIAGPSLPILEKYLERSINEKFIPYSNILGRYVSESEALGRYNNLKRWYQEKGHFLIGNGPFYLDRVDPIAKIVVLKANREFPDKADKWLKFSKAMIPEVKVTLEPIILRGLPSEVDVSVTFEGKPYNISDTQYVKYVIISPAGVLVGSGEPLEDGKWRIIIEPEKTVLLPSGALSIDVIVVSKLVGIPAVATGVTTVMSISDYISSEQARMKADYEAKILDLKNMLEGRINELNSKIDALNATINSLVLIAIAAIILSIVAIIISIIKARK